VVLHAGVAHPSHMHRLLTLPLVAQDYTQQAGGSSWQRQDLGPGSSRLQLRAGTGVYWMEGDHGRCQLTAQAPRLEGGGHYWAGRHPLTTDAGQPQKWQSWWLCL
jgi:hypothetical protein